MSGRDIVDAMVTIVADEIGLDRRAVEDFETRMRAAWGGRRVYISVRPPRLAHARATAPARSPPKRSAPDVEIAPAWAMLGDALGRMRSR